MVSPGAAVAQDLPAVDNGSDYSSVKVPSLRSEESSSSYTKRTSLFEPDVPTTREEVSRIVESMRKNYLKALEAKIEEQPTKPRRPRRSKLRSSYTNAAVPASSGAVKTSKGGRQSWHAATAHVTTKQEKPSKKQTGSAPKMPREPKNSSVRSASSSSGLNRRPQLYRADSTTLGSFFGAKKGNQTVMIPTARAVKDFRPAQSRNGRPLTHDIASPRSSSETIAPEIDDFDIFYQDLTRDLAPTSKNKSGKSSLPAIYVQHNLKEKTQARPGNAAPPPPNIDSTPHKRSGIAVF